ncbi:olfactory receptor 2K2-like, partial [Betta splendens]|uniref:Olfactory receptor 2K2-like n=1 Tax=Betta splendens TaxID=158456 RepID=A0A6P7PBX3_BETSP
CVAVRSYELQSWAAFRFCCVELVGRGCRAALLWMANATSLTPLKQPIVFELEGFFVPPGCGSLLFVLALLNYLLVLLANGAVLCVIVLDKNLHRPMFIMICHLLVCDVLLATSVLPRLMLHLLTGERRMGYASAIAQAFCVQATGVAMQTVLAAMAYDRYVGVCEPLRYHSIMTSARLHACCALAWCAAVLFIAVLFVFHIDEPLCGNVIRHVYCSNRAILNLACGPTPGNDIYGLSMTWCLNTGDFLIIAFSYIRILHASVKHGRGVCRKAFQTCASHIFVYVIYEIATMTAIVSQRFPSVSQNVRQFISILFVIVPPSINPIIYGLVSKELRTSIIKLFTVTACPTK